MAEDSHKLRGDSQFMVDSGESEFEPDAPNDAEPQDRPSTGLGGLANMVSGNLLLIGMYAAGIGCLYFMSLMKGPNTASAEQIQVESTVDDALARLSTMPLTGSTEQSTTAIVGTFYYEAKHRQIPISRLKTNPFILKQSVRPKPVAVEPLQKTGEAPQRQESETGKAMAAAEALRLQSVLMGSRQTVAIISDNLLTEGQSIHGWTVQKIMPREVILRWKDHKFLLRMPE